MDGMGIVIFECWRDFRSCAIEFPIENGKTNGLTAKAVAKCYAELENFPPGHYVFYVAKPGSNYVATVDLVVKVKAKCRHWRAESTERGG